MNNFSLNTSNFEQEILIKNIFPVKVTTTSYNNSYIGHCFSPYGLISNLNCPKLFSFCNCLKNTYQLLPKEKEPTDNELAEALNKTKECELIKAKFEKEDKWKKFFGIDFSDAVSSYNCSESFDVKKTKDSYYIGKDGITFGATADYDNAGYFPYARRKSYSGISGSTGIFAFPIDKIKINNQPAIESQDKMIGDFFPYYLEYSKTSATFWNTPIKTPLLRQAQVNLLFYQRIQILVNGDFKIKPGSLIEIKYPTPQNDIKNNKFSGKWMVYRVTRNINSQRHTMSLYLMRDSPYQSATYYNKTLKKDKGAI